MQHNYTITGKLCSLIPVSTEHAEFINSLRTNPDLSRYLHPVSGKVEDQLTWINTYYEREGDYYFIIQNNRTAKPEGTIGLYDIVDGSGEWGRWLLSPGSFLATESAFLIYLFGFETLGLDMVFCRTVKENEKVVSFHDSFGAERTAELKDFQELGGSKYDAVEHTIKSDDWPDIKSDLDKFISRMAQRNT